LVLVAARHLAKRRQPPALPYAGAAGGWGSAKSVASILIRERVPLKGPRLLWRQNKAGGVRLCQLRLGKPKSHGLQFRENGAKATAGEWPYPFRYPICKLVPAAFESFSVCSRFWFLRQFFGLPFTRSEGGRRTVKLRLRDRRAWHGAGQHSLCWPSSARGGLAP
jgi:hypothetical protein